MNVAKKDILYGDDFTIEAINQWYKEEEEAYANLYGESVTSNTFEHTNFDTLFGFNRIPQKKYKNVLGFGASWGYEFLPFIQNIEQLTIIESSEKTVSEKLGDIRPTYLKSLSSGTIELADNTFDLLTSFSVLHHIPNVTYVLSELIRITKKNGYLLIREPIHSMDLGNPQRTGLTKNERGIPKSYLLDILKNNNCEIVHASYHYFMYAFLSRKLKNPAFMRSKVYLRIDKFFSRLFLWNLHYVAKNPSQRIAPQYIYIVARKK